MRTCGYSLRVFSCFVLSVVLFFVFSGSCLLCFRHLSESRFVFVFVFFFFLLGALHRSKFGALHRSKFASFLSRFNAKPLVVTNFAKKFYSSQCLFFKNQIFSLFPIVKMNANYSEICRVGNLEADFQQVLLVQFFKHFHNIVVKHQQFKFSKEK